MRLKEEGGSNGTEMDSAVSSLCSASAGARNGGVTGGDAVPGILTVAGRSGGIGHGTGRSGTVKLALCFLASSFFCVIRDDGALPTAVECRVCLFSELFGLVVELCLCSGREGGDGRSVKKVELSSDGETGDVGTWKRPRGKGHGLVQRHGFDIRKGCYEQRGTRTKIKKALSGRDFVRRGRGRSQLLVV